MTFKCFTLLPTKKSELAKRQHRLINSWLSLSVFLPGTAPKGSYSFSSSRAVTAKQDFKISTVENQESIAQMLSKGDIEV